jgi:hypothetical protein
VPLRTPWSSVLTSASYEARLARIILEGGSEARAAAMTLLEHSDPPTLNAAVALVADRGTLTSDAFDLLADAWESYRHLKHLSWD